MAIDKQIEKEDNSALAYIDTVANALGRISVWKWVCGGLVLVIIALLWALISAIQSMPVRLVPHEFAASNGKYEIKATGESNREYLVYIAENDIKLLTDWTPATVTTQYARFLNRCAPELYAQKNIELLTEAESLRKTAYSQVFYPQGRKYIGPGRVQITGTLIRYAGEKIILQVVGVYTVSYRFFNGMPSMTEIQYSKPQDSQKAIQNPQTAVEQDQPLVSDGKLVDPPEAYTLPPGIKEVPNAGPGDVEVNPATRAVPPPQSIDEETQESGEGSDAPLTDGAPPLPARAPPPGLTPPPQRGQ